MEDFINYENNEKLLIINADDFGMSHCTNIAVIELLEKGVITSSTVMVPCPWFLEAASYCKNNPQAQANVGIHLTFNSEWKTYKWGPVTRNSDVKSLVTKEGYFPEKAEEVELNAKSEDVRKEIRNQIELAISMGIKPTHLDNHMGSLYGLVYGNDFLEIIFDFCEEYDLPFRIPKHIPEELKAIMEESIIKKLQERILSAEKRGITILDYLIGNATGRAGADYTEAKTQFIKTLKNLKPGVTEIYVHPAIGNEELKAITGGWKKRQIEYELLKDEDVLNTIKEENIKLISWKELHQMKKHSRS